MIRLNIDTLLTLLNTPGFEKHPSLRNLRLLGYNEMNGFTACDSQHTKQKTPLKSRVFVLKL